MVAAGSNLDPVTSLYPGFVKEIQQKQNDYLYLVHKACNFEIREESATF